MQNVQSAKLSASFKKMFPYVEQIILVTFSGQKIQLLKECLVLPISELHDFLLEI